ncbi:hydroxylysine kinase isoform X2 [Trichomycterus rosablanca]|uniref:hydroxylysine kinase isoform X2 n=1 Tax=Trichomycterus rosablanca TaxID=2290929 RepID=UPI002F34FF0D
MSIQKQNKPRLSPAQVTDISGRVFGLTLSSSRPLPSYDDQNFHVVSVDGREFVLKIMNSADSQNLELLQLQTDCMNFLQQNGLPAQSAVQTVGGDMMSLEELDCGFGVQKYLVRLLTYLPGTPIAKITCTHQLLYQTGRMAATVDQVLLGMEHRNLRVLHRENYIWSLSSIPLLDQYLHVMDGEPIQPIVRGAIDQYRVQVEPKLSSFRKCLNHGDLNDQNILVEPDGPSHHRISGILDFGDMSSGCLIFELAIVMMYMMLESASPLAVGGAVLAGWESALPLNADERDALYTLVMGRFCQSLVLARHTVALQPENEEYLMISARNGMPILRQLWEKGKQEVQRIWFEDAARISTLYANC